MKSSVVSKLTFEQVDPDVGLRSAIDSSPEKIIQTVLDSGLRGRGGGAFPVGRKWQVSRSVQAPQKYVVCNAAEGEPGSFKDRAILSGYAQLVFEGMTIAALAVGAQRGIMYLRGEYGYMAAHMESVLAARRKSGLLGKNILGKKGVHFDIKIQLGEGAYVCGQETALIEFLEGHRGEPRNRPPYPAVSGYRGCPTVVQNVETWAWVTCVMARGASWFKNLGTDESPGLKLFSVSGDCKRPGVYEFQLGLSIAELLDVVGGEDAKGVQVGGASGTMIPQSQFRRKIAFEDLPYGGAVFILGEHRDMLEVAGNYLEFFTKESCGQCTPCREGTRKLLDGVNQLREGRCRALYLEQLISLGKTIQMASKCGLGQSSPQAFLSIVEHYREELMGRVRIDE
ncbi:MAG: dehydrogenase [Deltaproteobacteria bacterium]|nr:dehydrogenase [Deltaproteobacteria bacterium]MBN2670482.1 dehydrogenase [Deltaproteobacteria bacterium]